METIEIEGTIGDYITDAAARAVDAFAAAQAHAPGREVVLVFNDVRVPIRAGMTAGDAVSEYHRLCDERHAAYLASPEYKQRKREAEEEQRRKDALLADVLSRAPGQMSLRDADAWKKSCELNKDGYGGAVISYAERWARLMEAEIAAGKTVKDCARSMSSVADVEGITGFMYGCAVSILAQVWAHGEDLRRWHNLDTQIGTEGEKANESGGTLNPALLSIG